MENIAEIKPESSEEPKEGELWEIIDYCYDRVAVLKGLFCAMRDEENVADDDYLFYRGLIAICEDLKGGLQKIMAFAN